MAGYIKLQRKFFENVLWKEPRVYSRAEAWLDLIQSARFDSSSVILNDRVIEVRKGEVAASRRYLETKWCWGSSKVTNFLEMLKLNQMITTRQTNGQTILTLCNYEHYNEIQTTKQTNDKPATNQGRTNDKPNINKGNKVNKGNSKDIATKVAPSQREADFYNSIALFSDQYDKQMLRAFFDYWSEKDRYGTKMRFEMQPTFEVERRLKTWSSKNFNQNGTNKSSRGAYTPKYSDEELMRNVAEGIARAELEGQG